MPVKLNVTANYYDFRLLTCLLEMQENKIEPWLSYLRCASQYPCNPDSKFGDDVSYHKTNLSIIAGRKLKDGVSSYLLTWTESTSKILHSRHSEQLITAGKCQMMLTVIMHRLIII